jgi:hypothetical protein
MEENEEVPGGDPKLSVSEFAAQIKAKYPAYASMDDHDLVVSMVSKYPAYASRVDFHDIVKKKSEDGTGLLSGSSPASDGNATSHIPMGNLLDIGSTNAQKAPDLFAGVPASPPAEMSAADRENFFGTEHAPVSAGTPANFDGVHVLTDEQKKQQRAEKYNELNDVVKQYSASGESDPVGVKVLNNSLKKANPSDAYSFGDNEYDWLKKTDTWLADNVVNPILRPAEAFIYNHTFLPTYAGSVGMVNKIAAGSADMVNDAGKVAGIHLLPDGMRNFLDEVTEADKNLKTIGDGKDGLAGDIVGGVTGALPMIAALPETGASAAAAEIPELANGMFGGSASIYAQAAYKAITAPIVKLFAITSAAGKYHDSAQAGNTVTDNLGNAISGGVGGVQEGLALEAQMLVGGSFGKNVANALAEKGLFAGGKAAKALIHAISIGGVFGGSAAAEGIIKGNNPEDIQNEAVKQFFVGAAFGMPEVAGHVFEGIDNKKQNDQIAKTGAMAQAVQEQSHAAIVSNLMGFDINAIKQINSSPVTADQLYASSLEVGAKAYEETDPQNKRNLFLQQVSLKNQGDIKRATETITANPADFLQSVFESDLPAEDKVQLLTKVSQINKSFNPLEIEKTQINQSITEVNGHIQSTQDAIAATTDEGEKAGHYSLLNDMLGKRVAAQNRLFEINQQQLAQATGRDAVPELESQRQQAHDNVKFVPGENSFRKEGHWVTDTPDLPRRILGNSEEEVRTEVDNYFDSKYQEIKQPEGEVPASTEAAPAAEAPQGLDPEKQKQIDELEKDREKTHGSIEMNPFHEDPHHVPETDFKGKTAVDVKQQIDDHYNQRIAEIRNPEAAEQEAKKQQAEAMAEPEAQQQAESGDSVKDFTNTDAVPEVKPVPVKSEALGEAHIIGLKDDGAVTIKLADGHVEDVPKPDHSLLGITHAAIDEFKRQNTVDTGVSETRQDRIQRLAEKIHAGTDEFTDEEVKLHQNHEKAVSEAVDKLKAYEPVNEMRKLKVTPPKFATDEQRQQRREDYEKQLQAELDKVRHAKKVETSKTNKAESTAAKPVKNAKDWMSRILSPFTPEAVKEAKANLVDIQRRYREEKKMLRAGLPRERGANFLVEKLSRAARRGEISQVGADLAIELIRSSPELYKDLAISISGSAGEHATSDGWYRASDALMKVLKGGDPLTATHEILHHTERFLPDDIRDHILKEWHDQVQRQKKVLQKELAKETDPDRKDKITSALLYLGLAERSQVELSGMEADAMRNTMMKYLHEENLGQEYYQLANPSEWWAVNASEKFLELKSKEKPEGWIAKAKDWYTGLVKAIKTALGMNPTEHVEKGLKAVLDGDVLNEMKGSQLSASKKLFNINNGAAPDPRPERLPGEALRAYTERLRQHYIQEEQRNPTPPPAPAGSGPSWNLEPETKGEYLGRKWQDYLNRQAVLQKVIERAGGTINERSDYYTAADLQGARAAEHQRQLYERMVASPDKDKPAFFQRMHKDGVEKADLDKYLRANHVEEYNREIGDRRRKAYESEMERLVKNREEATSAQGQSYYDREIKKLALEKNARYPLMDDGASGMTTAEAHAILDGFRDDGKFDKLKEYGDEFVKEVSNRQLEVLKNSGLMDNDTHDMLKEKYKNYVPFHVEAFLEPKPLDPVIKRNSGSKLSTVDNIIRRAKGSVDRKADERVNPSTYGIVQLEKSYIEGEVNKTSNILYNLVEQNPNDSLWEIVHPTYKPQKRSDGSVSHFEENTPAKITNNSVQLYRDGRKVYIQIKDPTLKRAISRKGIQPTIAALDAVNNYLRQVNTLKSPVFWVTNAVKDFQAASFNMSTEEQKGLTKKLAKGVLPAMKAVFQFEHGNRTGPWADTYQRYLDAGGKTTVIRPDTDINKIHSIEKLVEDIGKQKNLIQNTKAMVHWISTFGEATEIGTRLSVFKAGIDSGMTDQQAATLSRNATINFNKKGEWSGLAGNAYLMFNGGMQGKLYLFKKLYTSPVARKIFGGIFAAGFLGAALNHTASDPDDPANDYGSITEYEKQNNFIFKKPFGDGFIKIPGGHGLNFPYYLGGQIYEVMFGHASAGKAAMNSLNVAFNAYSPVSNATLIQTITPTEPFRWIVQHETNTNAFGSPVFKESKFGPKQPNSHTHFEHTDPTMVKLAQGLNSLTGGTAVKSGLIDISPDTFEWLVTTGGGGLGRTIEQTPQAAADITEHVAAKLGWMPDSVRLTPMDMSKVPFLSKFYTEGKAANYKATIFETLDKSGNHEISGPETNDFFNAAGNAVGHGQITGVQYKEYIKQFQDNQIRLQIGDAAPNMEKKDIDMVTKKKKFIR